MTANLKELFTKVSRYKYGYEQGKTIKAAAKDDDKEARKLLLEGIRLGFCAPLTTELWSMLKDAEGLTASDVLQTAKNISAEKDQGEIENNWGNTAITNFLSGVYYVVSSLSDKTALINGWKELSGPIRGFISIALARCGALSAKDLDPEVSARLASAYLTCLEEGSSSEKYYREDCFGGVERLFGDEWGSLLVSSVETLRRDSSYVERVKSLTPLLPYLANLPMEQLLLFIDRTPDGQSDLLIDLIVSRKEAALPPLVALLDEMLAKKGGYTSPQTIVCASVLLLLSQKKETLDARYDEVLLNAVGVYSKRLDEALAFLPAERRENILMGRWSIAYQYFPRHKSPSLLQALLDKLSTLRQLRWEDLHYAPKLFLEFGKSAEQPLVKALDGSKALFRHLFLRALVALNVSSAIPVLVKLLEDNEPRAIEDANRSWPKLVKDMPELAGQALITLSQSHPEGLFLPLLTPLLSSKKVDTRAAALAVLEGMKPTEARATLAKELSTKERSKDLKARLEKLSVEKKQSTGSLEPLWLSLEEEKRAKITASLEKTHGRSWQEHKEVGPALVFIATELAKKRALLDSFREYSEHSALLHHFKEAPGVKELAADLFFSFSKKEKSTAYLYVASLRDEKNPVHEAIWEIIRRVKGGARPAALVGLYEGLYGNEYQSFYIEGFTDKDKEVRATCVKKSYWLDEEKLPEMVALLSHSAPETRLCVAEVLKEQKWKDAAGALKEALSKEPSDKVAAALQEALTALGDTSNKLTLSPNPSPETDAALDKTLSQRRLLNFPEHLQKLSLPVVHWKTGGKVSEKALHWILWRLLEETPEAKDDDLWAVRSRLQDTDANALYQAIRNKVNDKWQRMSCALLGSEQDVEDIAKGLDEEVMRGRPSQPGLQMLLRHGSEMGLRWLAHWSRHAESKALRTGALAILDTLATTQDLEATFDALVSTHGFSKEGKQPLPYGKRTLTLSLTSALGVEILEGEKKLTKLPAPRAGEDEAQIRAAKKNLTELKKKLKEDAATQRQRLEEAMIIGRSWSAARWKEVFVRNPLMHQLACGILWSVTRAAQTILCQVKEEKLLDQNQKSITLEADDVLAIPHPATLTQETVAAWKPLLAPSISQLEREVARLSAEETQEKIEHLITHSSAVDPLLLRRKLTRNGYLPDATGDGGMIYGATRRFGLRSALHIKHEGIYVASVDVTGPVLVEGASASRDGKALPWAEVNAAMRSELMCDLQQIL